MGISHPFAAQVPPAPRREATPAKAEEPPSKTPQTKKKTSKTRLAPSASKSIDFAQFLERQRRDTSSREARKSRNQPAYSFAPQLCEASLRMYDAHNRGAAPRRKQSRPKRLRSRVRKGRVQTSAETTSLESSEVRFRHAGETFLDRQNRAAAKAARVRAKRPDDDLDDARSPRTVDDGDDGDAAGSRGRARSFRPSVTSRADRHPRRSDDDLSRLDAIRRRLAAEKAVAKREKALRRDETFAPKKVASSARYDDVPSRLHGASRRDREASHHVKDELAGCTFEPRLAASCPTWISVLADESRKRRGPKPPPPKAWM